MNAVKQTVAGVVVSCAVLLSQRTEAANENVFAFNDLKGKSASVTANPVRLAKMKLPPLPLQGLMLILK